VDQLTRLWGDESWKEAGYATDRNLFNEPEKVSNEEFAEAIPATAEKRRRVKYVPAPMPMKTKSNSTIYYLYFASQKPAAADIVRTSSASTAPSRGFADGDNSHIEWTDATWNPVTGCSKISPGCKHCYAERLALRLQAMGQKNTGTVLR